MKISEKKVVALTYELVVDGQVADKTTKEKPLDFIQGMGYLLPLFEKNIEGLEPGGKFAFTLQPEDGYGVWENEKVIDLPKEAFVVDGVLREDLLAIGSTVPLVNSMGGVIPGKVLEVASDTVKIDVNHPMAGKVLNFSGEIVSVREATEQELTEGLHGEFVQSHSCGGHCGECGGCGEEHEEGHECCGKGKKEEGHECCGKGKGKCHNHKE